MMISHLGKATREAEDGGIRPMSGRDGIGLDSKDGTEIINNVEDHDTLQEMGMKLSSTPMSLSNSLGSFDSPGLGEIATPLSVDGVSNVVTPFIPPNRLRGQPLIAIEGNGISKVFERDSLGRLNQEDVRRVGDDQLGLEEKLKRRDMDATEIWVNKESLGHGQQIWENAKRNSIPMVAHAQSMGRKGGRNEKVPGSLHGRSGRVRDNDEKLHPRSAEEGDGGVDEVDGRA